MIIEEVFIQLFKDNCIQEFQVNNNVAKKYFQMECKKQKFRKYTFKNFLIDLKRTNIASTFTTSKILFNAEVIYQLEKLKLENKTNFLETLKIILPTINQYMNEKTCLLCYVTYANNTEKQKHVELPAHKLRLDYVKNLKKKKMLSDSQDLSLEVIDCATQQVLTTVQKYIKNQFQLVVFVTNTSQFIYKIKCIVKLNPYILDMSMKFKPCKYELKSGEKIVMELQGKFTNSTTFKLPLGIVATKCRSTTDVEDVYILKEIPIEIKSMWSYLDSHETYIPKKKVNFVDQKEEIIFTPPEKEGATSNYKESFRLQKYEIPNNSRSALVALAAKYPFFIRRESASRLDFIQIANELKLPIKLDDNNYVFLLRNLLDIEENQMGIDIKDYNTTNTLKFIKSNVYELNVPGLAESRPSLIKYDSVFIKESEKSVQKYEGKVQITKETSVELRFNELFSKIFINNKTFHIEFGFNRRPMKVEKQAVNLVYKHQVIPYFFPKEVSSTSTMKNIETFVDTSLNDEQRAAINNLMQVKNAPYLIFGPPGTGKTVTVVEAILQIWKNLPAARVLVCAPSNAAANEIAIRLFNKIPSTDILRLLGNTYGSDNRVQKMQKICNISRDGTHYMPSMAEILKYRVVLVTLVTAARLVNGGVPYGHYSYVFIDESGFATETESLIPVAGILSNEQHKGEIGGQVVLAGDPRQLGPLIHSNFVKFCGFGTSMLERLIDTCAIYARNKVEPHYNPKFVTKLVRNYRSHTSILAVPNKLFYHNELIAVENEWSRIFLEWKHLKSKNFPVIFHNVVGDDKREKSSPSFYNTQEIEEVMGYLTKIFESRVSGIQITQDQVGIITPYRKQAEKLRNACQSHKWGGILTGTVEQFQGRESLVIILSTVRSKNVNIYENVDSKFRLGFVRNAKRFNVALTRAKALLIVVGNADVLKTDKHWRTFLQFCVENKSVDGRKFVLSDDDIIKDEEDILLDLTDSAKGNEGTDFSRGNI